MIKITLAATEPKLGAAWQEFCGDLDEVAIHAGSILDVACDAVVSPANSFGFMDGGIDLAYSEFFGWRVQDAVQAAIREHHQGELLVGNAEIVETGKDAIPFLIAAPTMRVPMPLRNSLNPYLAARAVLLLVTCGTFRSGARASDRIASRVTHVAFPGLGTGVGELDPRICARQFRAAILDVLHGDGGFPRSWIQAQARHYELVRPFTPNEVFKPTPRMEQ